MLQVSLYHPRDSWGRSEVHHRTQTILKLYRRVPGYAIATGYQGGIIRSEFSGGGVGNLSRTRHIRVKAWALESDGRVDLVSQTDFPCLGKPIHFSEPCFPSI